MYVQYIHVYGVRASGKRTSTIPWGQNFRLAQLASEVTPQTLRPFAPLDTMSSQKNNGIPLEHAPDGLGYRLLELPPELVSLIEGDDPSALTLESSEAVALLKTADRTYSLRQKNTSNTLFLLSPTLAKPCASQLPEVPTGLSAIATIRETVELVPGTGQAAPATATKGKWHERFGRSR